MPDKGPVLVDIKIDLGKFARLCREQMGKVPEFPHGFSEELLKGFARQCANQPFTWDRFNKQLFDRISKQVVVDESVIFDDVIYVFTEPRHEQQEAPAAHRQ